MSELPSYGEMAAEKLKERSKASGGELKNFVSYSTDSAEMHSGPFTTFCSLKCCNKYIKSLLIYVFKKT